MIIEESNKNYHENLDYISKSRLAKMSVCPAYFKWCEENPQESSEDLIVGSAFHKIVLEPETFEEEFAVMHNYDKRTKVGKELYEQFIEANVGKSIITEEQYNMICSMRDSIMSSKYAKALLNGTKEHSIYFEDDLTQEKCKCRPDCYRAINDRIVITDLKSCKSAITEDFVRDVTKYGYDLQSYMYRLGVSLEFGVPIENVDFVFIAVEKKEPYLINILQANDYVSQRGQMLFRKYIGQYHECKEQNNWYGLNGAYGSINELSLPDYIIKNIENN